jgi:5'-nucleotidase
MTQQLMLTNDDGIGAVGIKALEKELSGLGDLLVVAPAAEQSASSHSLTLNRPIRTERVDERHFKIHGTPTDCVLVAVQGFLDQPPDYLISGINHGPNMGEDVFYSGTVAAAMEGMILGIPSIAISSTQRPMEDALDMAKIARVVVETVMRHGLPAGCLLNVNIPNPRISPVKGVEITKLGSRAYYNLLRSEPINENTNDYTIGGDKPVWKVDERTDIAAIRRGYVSITPLHVDLTSYKLILDMEKWRFDL